jgi:hypothetical protein
MLSVQPAASQVMPTLAATMEALNLQWPARFKALWIALSPKLVR